MADHIQINTYVCISFSDDVVFHRAPHACVRKVSEVIGHW